MHILSYLLHRVIKSIIVVEVIEIKTDNSVKLYFNLLILTRKKQNIFIEKKILHSDIENLENTVSQKEVAGLPILTLVNSNKILHKKVVKKDDFNVLDEVAPGIDPENLFYQKHDISDSTIFISAARKTFIEDILEKFGSQKQRIIKLFVSPASIFDIYTMAFSPDADNAYRIKVENFNFEFINDDLINFNVVSLQDHDPINNEFIEFNGEHVESSLLIPFSYGLLYFLSQNVDTGVNNTEIVGNKDNYHFRVVSKFVVARIAIILFALLLTSSYLFSIYRSKNASLDANRLVQLKTNESRFKNDSLTTKYMQLLEENGMSTASIISFYADEITSTLLDDIYLKKLEINPLNNRSTSENNVAFLNNTILVNGNCYSSNDLNDWIKLIRNKSWVKEVVIREFIQSNENELGHFLIEIKK